MDVERRLISFCIHNRTLAKALENNITPSLFSDKFKPVWEWMIRFYREHGEAPGEDALEDRFDDFTLVKPTESLSYWCERVRERFIFAETQKAMTAASVALKQDCPRDAIDALRKAVSLSDTQAAKKPDIRWSESVQLRLDRYRKLKESGGIEGFPFPFPTLTRGTSGLQKGDYVMLVAPSGVGKTFFLLVMSAYAMRQGKTVFFSSREMTNTQILQRLDAILYNLPYKEFRRGDLDTDTERFYYDEMEKVKSKEVEMGEFILNDDSYGGVSALRAKIEQHEPDIAIIDGFYLMDDDQGLKSGWEKIQNISQDMKRLAKDTGIPLLATGQLNDEKQIAFFKGLERDLDLLIELEQTTDERISRLMNLNIRKQREGSKFRVRLKWDMDTMTFEEDDSGNTAMEW